MTSRLTRPLLTILLAAAVLPGAAWAVDPAGGGGRVDEGAYTSAEGTFKYLAYVPKGWKRSERLPLYVMLHGCGTTPEQQMNANAMNPIADRERIVLLYPDVWEPGKAIGAFGQCFRGSSGAFVNSQVRGGGGDADEIAAMTNAVMSRYAIDRERVYLIGMSAGAFQAADTAFAYPDIFAAAGVTGGGLYGIGVGCTAMTSDVVPADAQLAASAMGPRARPIPFFTIGGTLDGGGEAPSPGGCARLGFEQAMATDNIVVAGAPDGGAYTQDDHSTQTGAVPGGYRWTRYVWRDKDGCEIGQRWVVEGMAHFWPGGSSDPKWAEWTDPKAPSAAEASWRFFKQFTLSGGNAACGQDEKQRPQVERQPQAEQEPRSEEQSQTEPMPQAEQQPQTEQQRQNPQPAPPERLARLSLRSVRVGRDRTLRLALSCPVDAAGGCRGTIVILRGKRAITRAARVSIAAGDRLRVRARLSDEAYRGLPRHGTLRVRAVVRGSDGGTRSRDLALQRGR